MEKRDVLIIILFVLVIASLVFSVYSYTINAKKISEDRYSIDILAEAITNNFILQKKEISIIENELNITFKEKLKEMQEAEKASLTA